MNEYVKPPIEAMLKAIRKYDKRVGLRLIYKEYHIPDDKKKVLKLAWDYLEKEFPDAVAQRDKQEGDLEEYLETAERGLPSEAVDSDSDEQSGQEQQEALPQEEKIEL